MGERMKPFRFIDDLTSDVMFEARGKTLNEIFESAAMALFSVITQLNRVRHKKSVMVNVRGLDLEDLMFNWLQELITLVDTEEMFFSKFEVSVDENKKTLQAKCYGEEAKANKSGTVVKAVTYYKFRFEKTKNGYLANVSLDI